MSCNDLVDAVCTLNAEHRPDERGDRIPGHRRHVDDRDRACADRRTDQVPSKRREVCRSVGETHVRALADGQQLTVVTLTVEEPIAPECVLGGWRVPGLNPEERPVETRVRLCLEELAIE